jgi:hypothetical protein
MLDGDTPLVLDVDDLAMASTDRLDQFRDRGMEDSVQRKLVGRTLDTNKHLQLFSIVWKGSTA